MRLTSYEVSNNLLFIGHSNMPRVLVSCLRRIRKIEIKQLLNNAPATLDTQAWLISVQKHM